MQDRQNGAEGCSSLHPFCPPVRLWQTQRDPGRGECTKRVPGSPGSGSWLGPLQLPGCPRGTGMAWASWAGVPKNQLHPGLPRVFPRPYGRTPPFAHAPLQVARCWGGHRAMCKEDPVGTKALEIKSSAGRTSWLRVPLKGSLPIHPHLQVGLPLAAWHGVPGPSLSPPDLGHSLGGGRLLSLKALKRDLGLLSLWPLLWCPEAPGLTRWVEGPMDRVPGWGRDFLGFSVIRPWAGRAGPCYLGGQGRWAEPWHKR